MLTPSVFTVVVRGVGKTVKRARVRLSLISLRGKLGRVTAELGIHLSRLDHAYPLLAGVPKVSDQSLVAWHSHPMEHVRIVASAGAPPFVDGTPAIRYSAYDRQPLSQQDEWGDLESWRDAAGRHDR